MPAFGAYPIADAWPGGVGSEISSTYEGRHVTPLESDLIHPVHADGLVDSGDPVVIGAGATGDEIAVGVALTDAAAATDLIAVDTEGIWALDVVAVDDVGNSAVAGGEQLFINKTTAVVSKISNVATQLPFGYALGIVAGGATNFIAVKVHFDPPCIGGEERIYKTVTDGDFGFNLRTDLAGGASEGVGGYIEAHLTEAQTGGLYGFGSWINVDDTNLLDGSIITPFEGGIYVTSAEAAARVVFMAQGMYVGSGAIGAPASLHAWRLNVAQAAGNIDALIAAANPESCGYQNGVAGTGVVGSIPLADVVGFGVRWVDVHAAVA